jgi:hypothetical protein
VTSSELKTGRVGHSLGRVNGLGRNELRQIDGLGRDGLRRVDELRHDGLGRVDRLARVGFERVRSRPVLDPWVRRVGGYP